MRLATRLKKRTRIKINIILSSHTFSTLLTYLLIYLLTSFIFSRKLIILPSLINLSQHYHPSCIAHTQCDRVAHPLLRKFRTHPHHLLPQSPVVSLARVALVSCFLLSSQHTQHSFILLTPVLSTALLRPNLGEGLHSHEISH